MKSKGNSYTSWVAIMDRVIITLSPCQCLIFVKNICKNPSQRNNPENITFETWISGFECFFINSEKSLLEESFRERGLLMNEQIEALKFAVYSAAKEEDYQKALELLDLLEKNHHLHSWDIVFYRVYYRYGVQPAEAFAHIEEIKQAVVDSFATVLSQNEDILETLVCFQDVYDQIWDLSSRLQQFAHREYRGMVKGKSITQEFYDQKTQEYVSNLEKILGLHENFINSLGSLGDFTTINYDLIWDFFQSNDGIFCFLQVYQGDESYLQKREENLRVIQLKRPDYTAESLPTIIKPAEIRNSPVEMAKKKGFFARLFS